MFVYTSVQRGEQRMPVLHLSFIVYAAYEREPLCLEAGYGQAPAKFIKKACREFPPSCLTSNMPKGDSLGAHQPPRFMPTKPYMPSSLRELGRSATAERNLPGAKAYSRTTGKWLAGLPSVPLAGRHKTRSTDMHLPVFIKKVCRRVGWHRPDACRARG